MKKILLAGAVVAVLGLITIVIFLPRPQSLSRSGVLAKNVMFPSINNDEIYYYSGNSFKKYTPKDGKSKSLTATYLFPHVLSAKWSTKGVLFNAIDYKPTDSFSKILKSKGLISNQQYWWMANLQTGSISILENPVNPLAPVDVVWQNDSDLFYEVADTSDDTTYRAQVYIGSVDQPATKVLDHLGTIISNLISADKDSITYESQDANTKKTNLIRLTIANKKEEILAKDILAGTSISDDGQFITLYRVDPAKQVSGDFPPRDLFLHNTQTGKEKLLYKSFGGTSQWNKKLSQFLLSGTNEKGRVLSRVGIDGKLIPLRVVDKISKTDFESASATLVSINPTRIWATNLESNLYLLSSGKQAFGVKKEAELEFVNFDLLRDFGLTSFQVDAAKYAYVQYLSSAHQDVLRVVMSSGSITQLPPTSSTDYTITSQFETTTDTGLKVKAKLRAPDLSSTQLFLYDDKGTQLYDSGVIDQTTIQVK